MRNGNAVAASIRPVRLDLSSLVRYEPGNARRRQLAGVLRQYVRNGTPTGASGGRALVRGSARPAGPVGLAGLTTGRAASAPIDLPKARPARSPTAKRAVVGKISDAGPQPARRPTSPRLGLEFIEDDGSDQNKQENVPQAEAQEPEPMLRVRSFLNERGIQVKFDGQLGDGAANTSSSHLAPEDRSVRWLLDEFILETGMAVGLARRAVRRVVEKMQRERLEEITLPLFRQLSDGEAALAKAEWKKVATVFPTMPELSVVVLQHYIWQVKRKLTGRKVFWHSVPIIFGARQGSGKTTFVAQFISPMKEAATDPVLIGDIVDPRSVDIFRFPVINIDDASKGSVRRSMAGDFKSIITAAALRRRTQRSSMSEFVRQAASLIGTSNDEPAEIVDDATGNRRVIGLPFGTANEADDDQIQKLVTEGINYELLWRSVDVEADAPIKPHLRELAAIQRQTAKPDPIAWMRTKVRNAPEMLAIENRHGLSVSGLWELFCYETGSTMTLQAFGRRLREAAHDPTMPIMQADRTRDGMRLPWRRATPTN